MGYAVLLLGEKDGFDRKGVFKSALDKNGLTDHFEKFKKSCSGVRREHLPFRCPVRETQEPGSYEIVFDERNLSYNFDTLMAFIGEIISGGIVKMAKVLDNGRIGGVAYIITPGTCRKFEFFPNSEMLSKLNRGELTYADVLAAEDGTTVNDYLKNLQ